MSNNQTILQAIAEAGGAKSTAKLSNVMVLRKDQTEEVVATQVNLNSILKTDNIFDIEESNLALQSHDIVYVPKTAISSASEFVKMVYSGFLPPLDLYMRAIFYYD